MTNEQLGDLKNRLNSHRHINATKLKQLEELQTRYDLMVKEAEEAVQTDAGESETAAVCLNFSLPMRKRTDQFRPKNSGNGRKMEAGIWCPNPMTWFFGFRLRTEA